jgi:hypothetical protein
MTSIELDGKRLALLVVDSDSTGETDARVYAGSCRISDGRVELDRGTGQSPIQLHDEWLARMKPVPDSVREILLGAEYFVRLSIGSLPGEGTSEYQSTGLRWPPK